QFLLSMTSAEQTVTWLITLGVLESPKKTISDPEGFLQSSLKDGVVLCKLLDRLLPGSIEKIYQEPKCEAECLSNIREFVRGCGSLRVETFDANDLFQGQNFNKVLSSLVALNKVTAGKGNSCVKVGDMSDNSNYQMVVKARFNFQQNNEDELSFAKGDIIHVCRVEEGGWWEGLLNGKTGWFPSNYVREIKSNGNTLKSPPKGFDTPAISKSYYNVVLQNILETESEYAKELQILLSTYLRPLQASSTDMAYLMGNLEDICSFQQILVQSLEECAKLPETQQKVGGCFVNLMLQMKSLYVTYCLNHPLGVNLLTEHSEELGEFMEMKGASSPGILVLTTSLSKPFMRLEKYPTLLKELERHMEDYHPDRPDIQKSMTSFKNLSAQCQEVRKRKELELQILTETVRGWEGEDIKLLGNVIYMSQVMVQCGNEEKSERYFLLFPHVLLMLSASPRMSGFIYQGKLPLTGLTITKLEDIDSEKNVMMICMFIYYGYYNELYFLFQLPSHPMTPINKHSDGKPISVAPSYHTLPHPSFHGTSHSSLTWGPLEPPKTPKPWSLSCLRPAPPLRPSAALCYKEDLSKSPKTMKKLLPKRKPERKPSDEEFAVRKSTAALEEDAQILKVIEAYCTSAKTPYRKECAPQVLLPEEEKIIVEETKSNGQTVIEEKSLVDTVYALKDEVQELKQENKKMRRSLEEEQRARKELEKLVRKVLKNMNDSSWDETNL
uniref:Rho guanine nucleotide exchange factor (GEF) 7a n=2 Tax=Callorhinchus milii TaxID=7868 RepID=A0A4W3IVY2_CALMI